MPPSSAGGSPGHLGWLTVTLIVVNLLFNVLANVSFRYAAAASGWRGFLAWQVVGNLAGLITVVTLTLLLRHLPLHIAYPVTTGLALVGVQVVAALLWFQESISPREWAGAALIAVGVVLLSGR